LELEALSAINDTVISKGATIVLIAPQLTQHNRVIAEEKNITFPVLSDPGNETGAKYGLRYTFPDDLKQLYQNFGIHLNEYNGDDSWTLPMPARYIVNQDGIVEYAEINPDYTIRPDPHETVAALD
jgi:peroxiredoxin